MKVKKLIKILPKIAKAIGDEDLTISLAMSKMKYYISISTHTSEKFEFNHGGYQRTCELLEKDLNKDYDTLVSELAETYKKLLSKKGK